MATTIDTTVIAGTDGLTLVADVPPFPEKPLESGTSEQALRRRCAWCGEILDGLGPIPDGAPTTHGMCARCEAAFEAGAKL